MYVFVKCKAEPGTGHPFISSSECGIMCYQTSKYLDSILSLFLFFFVQSSGCLTAPFYKSSFVSFVPFHIFVSVDFLREELSIIWFNEKFESFTYLSIENWNQNIFSLFVTCV